MTNTRPLNKSCRKCGAASGEYCRHSSESKKEKNVMMDRRQIARQIWEAHKHWDGEKKFALENDNQVAGGREECGYCC
jgi:hypothetical protein